MNRKQRRNGARLLVVAIESADNKGRTALVALVELTLSTLKNLGVSVADCPSDVLLALSGVGVKNRWVLFDDYGDEHVFVLCDCGEFDLLLGVSSRRETNLRGQSSENLATNILLQILAIPDPSAPWRPLYGEVMAQDLSRLWRDDVCAAHIQKHCQNWDVVLWSSNDRLDFAIPGTKLASLIRSNQSTEQANYLIVNGSLHRASAHQQGKLKYARGATHPLVKVNAKDKTMSYDEDVVTAIRDTVKLLREGGSWDAVAAAVGYRIPANQMQEEPDNSDDGRQRVRTRAARNEQRVLAGNEPLPLKLLEDGSANPDYRSETIADLDDPGARLRQLLTGGLSIPRSVSRTKAVDGSDIAPQDCFLELYRTGIYRRLVKDQERSNSIVNQYMWSELNLGVTADGAFVLSDEDVEFLKTKRTGKGGSGSWGNNPIIGLFRVIQDQPIYTRAGWIDPTKGSFIARTSTIGGLRGLRVWFEPHGATPHANGCVVVGYLREPDFGLALSDMLINACTTNTDVAGFKFAMSSTSPDRTAPLKKELKTLTSRHDKTVSLLTDSDLSDRTLTTIKEQLKAIEDNITQVSANLAAATLEQQEADMTHDDTFDISDIASLAAILRIGGPVPPDVANKTSRMMRAVLPDARLTIQPGTGTILIEATLNIPNIQGVLTIPLCITMANNASDPWTAGVAATWWHQHTPIAEIFQQRGMLTKTAVTRWAQTVAQRLLEHAEHNARPLRGIHLAQLIARCPNTTHITAIRTAIDHGTGDPQLLQFLFEGPDIEHGTPWTKNPPWLRPSSTHHKHNTEPCSTATV